MRSGRVYGSRAGDGLDDMPMTVLRKLITGIARNTEMEAFKKRTRLEYNLNITLSLLR